MEKVLAAHKRSDSVRNIYKQQHNTRLRLCVYMASSPAPPTAPRISCTRGAPASGGEASNGGIETAGPLSLPNFRACDCHLRVWKHWKHFPSPQKTSSKKRVLSCGHSDAAAVPGCGLSAKIPASSETRTRMQISIAVPQTYVATGERS